jgi:Outer membrane protein beta-barrel domain
MKKFIVLAITTCLFAMEESNAQSTGQELTRQDTALTNKGLVRSGNSTKQAKGLTLKELLLYSIDGNEFLELHNKKFAWLWWPTLNQVFTDVPGESESYSSPLTGLQFGVNIPILVTKKMLVVTAGLEYSMEGSKYETTEYVPGGQEQKVENKARLNYLRLPIIARKYTKSGFYGEAGIQPGLLLSAKDKFNGQTASLKGDYKGFDMGLRFGVGYDFKKRFGVHANFSPGISNINKKGGPNDGKKDRNRSFGFGLSYYP